MSKDEQNILDYIKAHPQCTGLDIAVELDILPQGIYIVIGNLIAKKLIKVERKGAFGATRLTAVKE